MNHENAVRFRSLAEAHLYVSVAKADGVVSEIERRGAAHRARKAQKLLDVMGLNNRVSERIKDDVQSILDNPGYSSWQAAKHLDKAVELLKKARMAGDWSTELTAAKNEEALLGLARLDGYVMKESNMLKQIKRRLNSL